jgi:putative membrane protein
MKVKNGLYFDLIFISVIHLAGVIGIYFLESTFFLRTSSVSILIPLFLFCYRSNLTNKDALLFASVFIIGYTAEFLGVNYKILFGDYDYGRSLGVKLFDVSLIIGCNWLLLALISQALIKKIVINRWLIIIFSSLLMVLIDLYIEPVAPLLDFWEFKENLVPFSNYRDWFMVALIIQFILSFRNTQVNMFNWSLGYLIILVLFFSFFHFTIV